MRDIHILEMFQGISFIPKLRAGIWQLEGLESGKEPTSRLERQRRSIQPVSCCLQGFAVYLQLYRRILVSGYLFHA